MEASGLTGSEEDSLDLAALLEENTALRAENERLLAETAEYGLSMDLPTDPSSPQSAKAVSSRFNLVERQRQTLLGVRRLGDELQELSQRNAELKGEAGRLREENSRLNQQNAALRAASRATTPAVVTPAVATPVGKQAILPSVKPGDIVSGPLVLPGGLEKRAAQISTAIKRGDRDALNTCSEAQRKELVAAMLKVGLFDAAVPASMTTPPPEQEVILEPPPTAPIGKVAKEPAGGGQTKAVAADAPARAASRPAVPGAAPDAATEPTAAKLGLPPGAAPPVVAPPHEEAVARPVGVSAPVPPTAGALQRDAMGVRRRGTGELERQAQEIADRMKTCSDAERKELVAEMLRQGLFGGQSGPSPPSTAPMQRSDAKDSVTSTLSNFSLQELDENGRERVVREKLQELNTRMSRS